MSVRIIQFIHVPRDAIISNHLHQWVRLSSITGDEEPAAYSMFQQKKDVVCEVFYPFYLTLFCDVHQRIL